MPRSETRCGHPRGKYDPDCSYCTAKRRRAARRRVSRGGELLPIDRITTADLKDLQAAVRLVSDERRVLKERAARHAKAKGGELPASLVRAEVNLSLALAALKAILERHSSAVSSMGGAPIRRYRKSTPGSKS